MQRNVMRQGVLEDIEEGMRMWRRTIVGERHADTLQALTFMG
jgi:hypothetical protein